MREKVTLNKNTKRQNSHLGEKWTMMTILSNVILLTLIKCLLEHQKQRFPSVESTWINNHGHDVSSHLILLLFWAKNSQLKWIYYLQLPKVDADNKNCALVSRPCRIHLQSFCLQTKFQEHL